jgi:nucleoid-associated protein YgaU
VPGETSDLIQTDPSATPALTPQGSGSPSTATPVPATNTPAPAPTEALATAVATQAPLAPIEYVVQEGDTWNSIATAYGYDAATLAAANGYDLEHVLHPGDVLVIPQ